MDSSNLPGEESFASASVAESEGFSSKVRGQILGAGSVIPIGKP